MALKLLNPGLRPLGQFDLDDDAPAALVGGEYVELQADNVAAVEGYAADVGALVGADGGIVNFTPASRTAVRFGGLADEGGAEYGTLFGDIIGGNAGRMTQFGTAGGSVVVGPDTDTASGKVTVWAQEGLYGVTADAGGDNAGAGASDLIGLAANDQLQASNGDGGGADRLGGLTDAAEGQRVAIYVSAVSDTSLVSTTARAVGDAAITEHHAIFYVGNASA
jgi:hypothetical protein